LSATPDTNASAEADDTTRPNGSPGSEGQLESTFHLKESALVFDSSQLSSSVTLTSESESVEPKGNLLPPQLESSVMCANSHCERPSSRRPKTAFLNVADVPALYPSIDISEGLKDCERPS
jgi:hypothetical protein